MADSSWPVSSTTRRPWLLRWTDTDAVTPLLRSTRLTAAIPLVSGISSPPNSTAVSSSRWDICRNWRTTIWWLSRIWTRKRRRLRQAYISSLAAVTKERMRRQRLVNASGKSRSRL